MVIVIADINKSIRHTFEYYMQKAEIPKFQRFTYKNQYFLELIMIWLGFEKNFLFFKKKGCLRCVHFALLLSNDLSSFVLAIFSFFRV